MATFSTIHVLIVDDEPSICHSLSEFLEDFGFKVSSAENAEKAIELLEESSFDAAVVDLRLPGMSGEGLILVAHYRQPQMKFVIHTGSAGYLLSDELKAVGINQEYVFFKPQYDLSRIADAIHALVKKDTVNYAK